MARDGDTMNPRASFAELTKAELREHTVGKFVASGGTRPDVLLIEYQGQTAVLKDYGACDRWFRWLLGRLFTWREARVLETLDGITGVPRLIRRVDSQALLLEHVQGLPLKRRPESTPVQPDLDKLQQLVANIHARGVAHCDLRSFSNVLVTMDGSPYIVDFVAAIMRSARWNKPWNLIYRRFCQADDSALRKIKCRYAPEHLNDLEYRQLKRKNALEVVARAIGQGVRSLREPFIKGAR